MSSSDLRVHRDTYLDSLVLMSATVRMEDVEGVEWAAAVMASPSALEDLRAAGFGGNELDGLGANDLVLAARGRDGEVVEAGLSAGWEAAFSERQEQSAAATAPPRSTAAAVRANPESDVAIVSVPGEYAALEAHHALTAGLHVLLFSDGVPLAEEIELKQRAARAGLLVMGPGAGTAVIGGTGLGFANVLSSDGDSKGGVGVVAAAGTGAQEVSALLDRWGVGVTQVIGVGGRDLSEQVGGTMARLAVRTLDADPRTDAVLLVSKPPDPDAAAAVLAECRTTPAVAVFLGLDTLDAPAQVTIAPTLERGAGIAADLVGASTPLLAAELRDRVATALDRVDSARSTVRGLFSGGTLCYEAQLILEGLLGPVHSNEPLRAEHGLPAPEGAHVLLDLGAEEYTRGSAPPDDRPQHPVEAPAGAGGRLLGGGGAPRRRARLRRPRRSRRPGGTAVPGADVRRRPAGRRLRPRDRRRSAGALAAACRSRGRRLHRAGDERPRRARGRRTGAPATRARRGRAVRTALVTYSTKPRGGVVHTLALAEALRDGGEDVEVVTLGDPAVGFYRPVRVPVTVVPGPSGDLSLEEKVGQSIDRLTEGLASVDAAVLHTQDCISARAAARVRDAGAPVTVVRTVHHVDDFSSRVLMDCQRAAILEPDVVLVVSEIWRRILAEDYGVSADVVPNGVDRARFAGGSAARALALRASVGAKRRPLLLSVGGIEPRKGSDSLVRALARLDGGVVDAGGARPVLAVLGGHSFQDHRPYREAVLAELPELGLELGVDVVLVGTVPEEDMPSWYRAADVLAYPSVKEGFGLAVLEAMCAGVPVVTSDLPVFREYLTDGQDALLVPVEDVDGLAGALRAALEDSELRNRLVRAGYAVVGRFTWECAAERHRRIYDDLSGRLVPSGPGLASG